MPKLRKQIREPSSPQTSFRRLTSTKYGKRLLVLGLRRIFHFRISFGTPQYRFPRLVLRILPAIFWHARGIGMSSTRCRRNALWAMWQMVHVYSQSRATSSTYACRRNWILPLQKMQHVFPLFCHTESTCWASPSWGSRAPFMLRYSRGLLLLRLRQNFRRRSRSGDTLGRRMR